MLEAIIVGRQVLMIFIYVGIGVVCARSGIITQETGRGLSNFLLIVVSPVLAIHYYMTPYDKNTMAGLGLAFLLSIVFHLLATVGSMLLVPVRGDVRYRIERLGVMYSNCGYMAIPLVTATVGGLGGFYAMAYLTVFNVMSWTFGVMILTGKRRLSLRKMLLNPGIIGTATGFFFYFTQLSLPSLVMEAMDSILALNTPLAMIVAGVFLSTVNIKETFTDRNIYYTSFLRLLAFPLLMLALLKVFRVVGWMPDAREVVLTVMLACACPAGAYVSLFPARFGLDREYGSQIVAVSTLFSLLTLPLLTYLTQSWL